MAKKKKVVVKVFKNVKAVATEGDVYHAFLLGAYMELSLWQRYEMAGRTLMQLVNVSTVEELMKKMRVDKSQKFWEAARLAYYKGDGVPGGKYN